MGRQVRIGWSVMAVAGAAVLSAGTPIGARQQAQFRGTINLVAIDFLATQPDGQPAADLTLKDITLKVDGRVREIRSFQFVKLSTTRRESPSQWPTLPAPFGANDAPVPGRTVIIVVDHEQIKAIEGKNALAAAGRFLDRLTPLDRVGLVTMPNGKVETDLTTNHARVRTALNGVIGRAQRKSGISNISLDEAMTVLAEKIDPDKKFTLELVDRECKFAGEESACRNRVVQEALQYARELELATRASLLALKDILDGIAGVEGPKAVLFLSGSLVAFPDTHLDLDDVARAAARARAQMFIVQPHDTLADAASRDQSMSTTADMQHRVTGLQNLAGVTGGELFRISGLGDLVFGRIADQISSHYLLGFEPRPDEDNGKPHKVEIITTRSNVDIRARPMFILDDPRRPPAPMVLETLLRDLSSYRDVPLRATAFVFRDANPRFVKVVVVAEPIPTTTTLKSAAFALVNQEGQSAAQWTVEGADVGSRPLVTSAAVPPGDYRLRMVALDATGRRGAVDYEFAARLTDAPPLTIGTLMTGRIEQGRFQPGLVFGGDAASVTGYVEFYGTLAVGASISTTFEIADTPDGPVLASASGVVQASPQVSRFVATGEVPVDRVGPGDHLIRVVISVNDKVVGRTFRTFRKKP